MATPKRKAPPPPPPSPTAMQQARAALDRLLSIRNMVFVAASIGSIWAGVDVVRPLLMSDAPPLAGVATVQVVDKKVAQLTQQEVRAQADFRHAIAVQQASVGFLMRRSVLDDQKYWQAQRDLTVAKLKRAPDDAVAQAYLKVVDKSLADIGAQLRSAK